MLDKFRNLSDTSQGLLVAVTLGLLVFGALLLIQIV
jgi:hypothetical protein